MTSPADAPIPDELVDLFTGMAELASSRPGYVEAENYYTGNVREYFASAKLARRVERTGSKFRINVAKTAIEAVTDRLELAALTVADNDVLTQVLSDTVVDANELRLEAPMLHLKAAEYGDAYAFVWPGEDPGTVDVEYSSPLNTRAIYDPEHPRRISFVVKSWEVGTGSRKRTRTTLYYADRIEKWQTVAGTNGSDPSHWEQVDTPGEPWPLENPYGRVPCFHFRTARPYGRPLHADAYGAQDGINKLVVSMMGTADFHFIPQRAVLTENPTEGGEEDDDDFDDFEPDGLNANVPSPDAVDSATAKLRTGPGEMWILKNAKALVSLPPADPQVFLTPAEFFLRMMAQVTKTPLHMFDPGGDQPSGDSRRQSEGSLTKKVDRIEGEFGATWRALASFALRVLGHADAVVDVQWAPSEVVGDAEGWATASAKINAGVPVAQALLEMGYQPSQVKDWLTTNDEQDLVRKVQLLGQIATAAQSFGTAIGAGVLTAETVNTILDQFIGADDGSGA